MQQDQTGIKFGWPGQDLKGVQGYIPKKT